VVIARVWRITTPEEAEKEDREYYRNLTPNERVEHLLGIIHDWTHESERRLERTCRFVEVPLR